VSGYFFFIVIIIDPGVLIKSIFSYQSRIMLIIIYIIANYLQKALILAKNHYDYRSL